MSGLGKGVSGMVGISRNESRAGTFPDKEMAGEASKETIKTLPLTICKLQHL